MQWPRKKFHVLSTWKADMGTNDLSLVGKQIEVTDVALYLRIAAARKGVRDDAAIHRISQATERKDFLKRNRIHEGNWASKNMIAVCKNFISSMVIYTLHVVPIKTNMVTSWKRIESEMLRITLETYSKKRHERLRHMAGVFSQREQVGKRMGSLERRLRS